MVKVNATYEGDKHCEIIHGPSLSKIATDAPKDNNGRGESFSPTDLLAAATGSCMLTIMAIMAEKDGIDIKGAYTTVEKEMLSNPRRVGKLTVNIFMPKRIEDPYRKKLENAAHTCPVKQSLSAEMEVPTLFHYTL
ncbi:MAG: OsmC family protein [Pseudobdellovibrionaceae bacterium]